MCSVVVGLLTGCTQRPSDQVPWFSTPIEWGDAYRKADSTSASFTLVAAAVRLDSGGKAELADFPTGRTVARQRPRTLRQQGVPGGLVQVAAHRG